MKKIATLDSLKSLMKYLRNNFVAPKAKQLKTPRKIILSGAVTGEATFDGSGDITITTMLKS